jgi:hypothetical protein
VTMRRAVAGAAIGVAFLGITAASCDTTTSTPAGSSTPSTTAKNLAVGAGLKVTDGNGGSAFVTVESITYSNAGTGLLAQKSANGLYAVVNVLVQDDAGKYDTNPFYVKFQAADGTTYDAFSGNALTAGFDPQLSAGTLNAGQKTRGNVVFDIKAKGGLVQVTDSLFQVIGQWTAPAA